MAKFSGKAKAPQLSSPVRTKNKQDPYAETYEGGQGFKRDAKSELFLLAVTNMVGEDTYYESAEDRDKRFKDLAFKVTAKDPGWVRNFIPYLRNTMQMRSASVVLAAHYVAAKGPKGRNVVDSAISRADEPAEFLAYWAQTYGKNFPKPVKRGVADAILRLYDERNALKYDGTNRAWRFGDVIELAHPKPESPEQSALFRYFVSSGKNRDDVIIPESASILREMAEYYHMPVEDRRAYIEDVKHGAVLPKAMTWERLSEWLQGAMDKEAWEAIIPQMGYMALLRNLRNFEKAGVSDVTLDKIRAKLIDPDEVAKSRQFPIRFYSAWKATDSLTFGRELERALDLATNNVPSVKGLSLVLIDVSGSMASAISRKSTVARWEIASVFGAAFAKKNLSNVVAYNGYSTEVPMSQSVLKSLDKIRRLVGGGTNTWQAVQEHYRPLEHKRIILITDEQAHPGYKPTGVRCPIYTFNVAGYELAHDEQGKDGSYAFGGLTDAGFKMIAALEDLESGRWPWE